MNNGSSLIFTSKSIDVLDVSIDANKAPGPLSNAWIILCVCVDIFMYVYICIRGFDNLI